MENTNETQNLAPMPPTSTKKWYQHKGIITIIVLAFLVAVFSWIYFANQPAQDVDPIVVQHKPKNSQPPTNSTTTVIATTTQPMAPSTPSPVDITNWQTYTNSTIGLSFQYPPDWQIINQQVDPVTQGDNGGSSFLIQIQNPNPQILPITLSHSPLSETNKPLSDQINFLKSFIGDDTIGNATPSIVTTANGVEYFQAVSGDYDHGYNLYVWVPTGKYILAFDPNIIGSSADYFNHPTGNDKMVLDTLNKILASMSVK
jgi:hypothetical protein